MTCKIVAEAATAAAAAKTEAKDISCAVECGAVVVTDFAEQVTTAYLPTIGALH